MKKRLLKLCLVGLSLGSVLVTIPSKVHSDVTKPEISLFSIKHQTTRVTYSYPVGNYYIEIVRNGIVFKGTMYLTSFYQDPNTGQYYAYYEGNLSR